MGVSRRAVCQRLAPESGPSPMRPFGLFELPERRPGVSSGPRPIRSCHPSVRAIPRSTRLSKFGNARLRRTFWLAAQVAIQQRVNSFRDHFGRHIAKDRDNKDLRRKALTTVAAKMARVAHALVKTGTDYRPFLEGPVTSGRTPLCSTGVDQDQPG